MGPVATEHELVGTAFTFCTQSGSSAVVPCAHTRPLLHTPSAAFAFALGQDPWSYLTLSCTFPALHLLLRLVGILVVVYTCLPSLVHSQCRVCFCPQSGSLVVVPCATCLLPHTPSRAFAFMLSWKAWWWHCVPVLTPSCTLPHLADAKGLDR
jgi:hypothetical protein